MHHDIDMNHTSIPPGPQAGIQIVKFNIWKATPWASHLQDNPGYPGKGFVDCDSQGLVGTRDLDLHILDKLG